jgi:hypothetical protein
VFAAFRASQIAKMECDTNAKQRAVSVEQLRAHPPKALASLGSGRQARYSVCAVAHREY